MIKVSTPPQSLQAIVNHFQEVLPSRCPSCNQQQLRQTRIESHSPLLAFEWGVDAPTLNNTVDITVGSISPRYYLSGIIYLYHEQFTCHFVDQDGQRWFHDGIVTGIILIREPTSTTQHQHAILAIYRF
ncbi:hypothetical protein L208DRAFT_1260289 [Tricholoma matsutake]|nr:hypothetical protein L208DRAFT_1260289 [Tricholoma matsutake 945]